MPHVYNGRMLANTLGTPCVGCRITVSKKWVGRGPYACSRRPCQRVLAAAPCDDGHSVVALDDLVDLLDALPVVKDAGAALGDATAAASHSVDAPALVDAASQTDDVDGVVNEQLHNLHAIVAERDERIAELEARLDAYEDVDDPGAVALAAMEDMLAKAMLAAHAQLQEKEQRIETLLKNLAEERDKPRPAPAPAASAPRFTWAR